MKSMVAVGIEAAAEEFKCLGQSGMSNEVKASELLSIAASMIYVKRLNEKVCL